MKTLPSLAYAEKLKPSLVYSTKTHESL